jgi:hypothetical protein
MEPVLLSYHGSSGGFFKSHEIQKGCPHFPALAMIFIITTPHH